MNHLVEELSRLGAGADQNPTPDDVVRRDLLRGRAALTRRRVRRTVTGLGATAATAVLALAIAGGQSSPDPHPAARGLDLVAYTGTQLPGFTVEKVPEGFVLQGANAYSLDIALPGNHTSLNDYRGKLVVMLQSKDATGAPTGKQVEINGRPGTIYERKRKRIEQLASRVLTDSTTYGVVWAAEKSDDPFAEATWRKANPGFGISPTRAYLAKEAAKAKDSPADLAKFLRLHLGIRTKQDTRYLELPSWDASAGLVVESKLAGKPCHGGLDLASVNDIAALCWDFGKGDRHELLWRFWLPEERLADLDKRTAGEATVWVREGQLTLTPGNVIDNDFIVKTVLRDAGKFSVQTIGFDRWGSTDVVRRLMDEGLTCVPVGQGFASMSAPMKEILRLVLSKRYVHGGNPVMRWMVDNLAVKMDPSGNVKPDKDRSPDKIDGVSAAVTAMSEHMGAEAEESELPPLIFGM